MQYAHNGNVYLLLILLDHWFVLTISQSVNISFPSQWELANSIDLPLILRYNLGSIFDSHVGGSSESFPVST